MLKNNVGPLKNIKGVTLVEVMIALVVLLLVMMGLLQAALLSIDHNLRNVLRDQAVMIADQRMNGILSPTNPDSSEADYNNDPTVGSNPGYNGLRTQSFTILSKMASPPPGIWTAPASVDRYFRDLKKTYKVCWRITSVDSQTIQIEVAVGWDYKNENAPQTVGLGNSATTAEYVHQITTIRRAT